MQNPNLQTKATPTVPLSARYSGLRPLARRDGRAQKVDEIQKKAAELDESPATILLNRAIELAQEAETQSILDKATIKQLEASRPSKTDRRQIKGGLLLHTKVLGELYKKREQDDLKKQQKAEAARIRRLKAKKQPVSKKRSQFRGLKNSSAALIVSSESESEAESENQVVCIL